MKLPLEGAIQKEELLFTLTSFREDHFFTNFYFILNSMFSPIFKSLFFPSKLIVWNCQRTVAKYFGCKILVFYFFAQTVTFYSECFALCILKLIIEGNRITNKNFHRDGRRGGFKKRKAVKYKKNIQFLRACVL